MTWNIAAQAAHLKFDQAVAAVKDLRDQNFEKERVIERIKAKADKDISTLVCFLLHICI